MTPAPPTPPNLQRIETLAYWLDELIRIPGTRFRIGLESLIGLIPGVGDLAGLLMGGYVVIEAHRMGAPGELKLRMIRNVALDAVAGLVPVFGDLYDFAYRSNRRNLQLLLDHYRPAAAPPQRLPRRRRWLSALLFLLGVGLLWWFWSAR
ncbi:MAG: DUF4112 domain-containing protein [Stagnimonas sp.]|nr:DUF4112 domain-containing protein [Stagnimonas sp.]